MRPKHSFDIAMSAQFGLCLSSIDYSNILGGVFFRLGGPHNHPAKSKAYLINPQFLRFFQSRILNRTQCTCAKWQIICCSCHAVRSHKVAFLVPPLFCIFAYDLFLHNKSLFTDSSSIDNSENTLHKMKVQKALMKYLITGLPCALHKKLQILCEATALVKEPQVTVVKIDHQHDGSVRYILVKHCLLFLLCSSLFLLFCFVFCFFVCFWFVSFFSVLPPPPPPFLISDLHWLFNFRFCNIIVITSL